MKPSNGEHIINENRAEKKYYVERICAVLKEAYPELDDAIQNGDVILLTQWQFDMRTTAGFKRVVHSVSYEKDISRKAAYALVEEEHQRIYGNRRHSSYKSFMQTGYNRSGRKSNNV